ncbi:A24 family peptidase [Curtobacterium sp. MCBD17_019]|uniref:prepilin peptidase n=1 Tax=Curtobacterium sp. MCBD17_019 TaxID=2175669 RepID=UPI000DAA6D24|nr:A24 family peptidase [Curtobacterium sp. MCBD17_019]PZE74093.1 prepilin peptidase [Curtobacterium sp. MCBD17_019]
MTGITAVASVIALLGLLIGSFLNVVVYRVPAGISVVAPASACPTCGHAIRAVDNVPVLSWLLLRGRCRYCRARISVRYPLVEAITCGLFLAVAVRIWALPARPANDADRALAAHSVLLVAFLYLMAISVALSLIDVETHTLPNVIVLPAYPVCLVLLAGVSVLTGDGAAFVRGVIGLAALGLGYLMLAILVPGGMGLGDVKLAGVLGFVLAYLGWGPLAVGAFGAFLLGGIFAIVLVAMRRARRGSGIPFGPWMIGGAWVGVFLGGAIWNGYLGIIGLA